MGNIMLTGVTVFVVVMIAIGMKRGLVKTAFSFGSIFIALILVNILTPVAKEVIKNTPVYDSINQNIQSYVSEHIATSTENMTETGINNQEKIINELPLPNGLKESLTKNNNQSSYDSLAVNTFKEYVVAYLTDVVLNAVVYILLFMVISILMAIVLFATSILGVVYDKDIKNVLNKADQTIDDVVENSKLSTEEYGVYILKSDKAEELKDIENYNLGYNLSYAKDETDSVLKDVLAKANNKLIANEYDDLLKMADELLNTEKTAFIFNQAMLDLIENAGDDTNDGKNNGIYKNFTNKIKCIYVVNVKTAVKEYGGDKNVTKECFNVYISGIDTEGDVTAKSRSDVNIIMSINPVTHQVLLLSTPRDYYVPLSISNGVKDKLTHAGNYGINVSMDTLEMLYDIKLDYFIRLNFTGFVDIIDALGGIDVVSDYSFSTHGYSYSEGLNSNLSGIQALWFARERHAFAEGDNQRGRDQMKVIEAVIKKAQSSALLNNYDEIFANISKSFQTNMPKKDIKALVKYQLNETPNWKVVSTSVTGTGRSDVTYSVPNSRAYVMDPDANSVNEAKKLLQKIQNNKKIKVKTTTE